MCPCLMLNRSILSFIIRGRLPMSARRLQTRPNSLLEILVCPYFRVLVAQLTTTLKIAIYPAFDIYPTSLSNLNDTHYPAQSPVTPPIGLLRPSSSFTHHGQVDDIEVYPYYIDILYPVLLATVVLKSQNFA